MLKIGVIGAGHLGRIHLKCIRESKLIKLAGFYDKDPVVAQKVAEEYSIRHFNSAEELISEVDIVDVVTPTKSHYDLASKTLKHSKHLFIEKPVVDNIGQANSLISLAEEADVKVQVGHVERYNPAFLTARPYITKPMFIETHRLAQFNPRGTDVSVILDLMIHDIDVVLSTVKSNVRKLSSSGAAIVSDTPDIANARIEFDNGCVSNLTASRMSMKNMRKSRFFQKNAYISVDFLEKAVEIIRLKDVDPENADPLAMVIDLGEGKGSKQIYFDKPEVKPVNAIQSELEDLAGAVMNNTTPEISLSDGCAALKIAHRIIEKLNYSVTV